MVEVLYLLGVGEACEPEGHKKHFGVLDGLVDGDGLYGLSLSSGETAVLLGQDPR